MSFNSRYASLIWDKLYTVIIPDYLTLNPDYIKIRGVHTTEDKSVNKMLLTNTATVMIPVAKILEYFSSGVEVQIPSRTDMLSMHKDIELYLEEWKNHISYDINVNINTHKDLLFSLEKLSKHIYEKARPVEVINNLPSSAKLGLVNNFTKVVADSNNTNKPEYQGISSLLKNKTTRTRY